MFEARLGVAMVPTRQGISQCQPLLIPGKRSDTVRTQNSVSPLQYYILDLLFLVLFLFLFLFLLWGVLLDERKGKKILLYLVLSFEKDDEDDDVLIAFKLA